MSLAIDAKHYMAYIEKAAAIIHENGDYVTALDSATGDGDHWANMDQGFMRLLAKKDSLSAVGIGECFRQIAMLMMSGVGGSSGALYGSAYLEASKVVAGKESLNFVELGQCLDAMVQAMMRRGQSGPGFKTMIDALYPAVEAYKRAIAEKTPEKAALRSIRQAALDGAESTRGMRAVRGRACYREGKGVGHLDPGAVTRSYQIVSLCDYIADEMLG